MRKLENGQHFPYLHSWAISFMPSSHRELSAFLKIPLPVFPFHGHKEIKHILNGIAKFGEYPGAVKIRHVDYFPTFSFFSFFLYPCCLLSLYVLISSFIVSIFKFLTIIITGFLPLIP